MILVEKLLQKFQERMAEDKQRQISNFIEFL